MHSVKCNVLDEKSDPYALVLPVASLMTSTKVASRHYEKKTVINRVIKFAAPIQLTEIDASAIVANKDTWKIAGVQLIDVEIAKQIWQSSWSPIYDAQPSTGQPTLSAVRFVMEMSTRDKHDNQIFR